MVSLNVSLMQLTWYVLEAQYCLSLCLGTAEEAPKMFCSTLLADWCCAKSVFQTSSSPTPYRNIYMFGWYQSISISGTNYVKRAGPTAHSWRNWLFLGDAVHFCKAGCLLCLLWFAACMHACIHLCCLPSSPVVISGLLPTFLSPSQPIGRDLPQWSPETAALPSHCLFSWAGHPHGKSPKVAAGQGCVIDRWHNWLEAGLEWPYANEGLLPEVCLQGQSIEQGLLDWHPCRHPDNIFSFFIPASNNPEPISND